MKSATILDWLRTDDPARLEELWGRADDARRHNVGDQVHLRALVEFSNHCRRRCAYCGLRAPADVQRYRMTAGEIVDCAERAARRGCGTIVLQSGEDPGMTADWLAELIGEIKARTPLAVTLSVGERSDDELALWRSAGADRYLLRFETSEQELYDLIHPKFGSGLKNRLYVLDVLRRLGYETGSGVMVGIPGQTYDTLAGDIELFRTLDLDMIGVGPYIAHPATPLGRGEWIRPAPPSEQVPNTELMTCKTVALARLACPQANMPSTTALATINQANGRELGLTRGANVVMPNLTPVKYRALYEIYPQKTGADATSSESRALLNAQLRAIGRIAGKGQGGRLR